jgi:type II secretory pathway pseudopilin PulG
MTTVELLLAAAVLLVPTASAAPLFVALRIQNRYLHQAHRALTKAEQALSEIRRDPTTEWEWVLLCRPEDGADPAAYARYPNQGYAQEIAETLQRIKGVPFWVEHDPDGLYPTPDTTATAPA